MLDFLSRSALIIAGVFVVDWLVSTRVAAFNSALKYNYLPIGWPKLISLTTLSAFLIFTVAKPDALSEGADTILFCLVITMHAVMMGVDLQNKRR
jgi:hypothetical protein